PILPPAVSCGCRPGPSSPHMPALVSRPTVRALCDRWAAALLLSNGLEDPDCIELQQPLTSPIYCCGYIQDWGHETGKEVLPRGAGAGGIAEKIGCSGETLRNWVRQAERDAGKRPGLTTTERERIKELERENRELRRANEILRKAAAFFAQAELDRKQR